MERAYHAAYDMLGAKDAIVRQEMRSAQEFPTANTVNQVRLGLQLLSPNEEPPYLSSR